MSILFLTAAGAAPEAAAQFGLIPALKEGGPISIAIFSVMVIMSVFSFYIMFTKLFEQHKVLNQYKELRAQFWRAASLEEGAAKLDKNSAYRQVVDDGIAAQKQHGLLTDPGEAHDWIHNALERSKDAINSKLSTGLPFLATVGAVGEALIMTAIGLFVAVPAVLAYNWLQARNKTIASSLAVFSNEIVGFMSSGGRLKPAVTAAAAGKPATAAVKK